MAIDLCNIQTRLKAFKTGLPLLPGTATLDANSNSERLCLEYVYNVLGIVDLYLLELDGGGGGDDDELEEKEGSEDENEYGDRNGGGGRKLLSKRGLLAACEALPAQLVALILFNDLLAKEKENGGNLQAYGQSIYKYYCTRTSFSLPLSKRSYYNTFLTNLFTLPGKSQAPNVQTLLSVF